MNDLSQPAGPGAQRRGQASRRTNETDVTAAVALDGQGRASVATGIGFFDHMLNQLARHSGWDIELTCKGDLHVDGHHTVEDCGIALGQALGRALGDKAGISRYGSADVPMDEALARCAVDISGRPFLVCRAEFPVERVGDFDTQLVPEFFRALATQAGLTLHLELAYGSNGHHMVEALFKAAARALGAAARFDPRVSGVPSTKGLL